MSATKMLIGAYVLRGRFESTNNGVSSRRDHFDLWDSEPENPTERDLVIVRRTMRDGGEYVHAKPAGEMRHCMMGGNFVYSSDGRFSEINQYPIPVHDRIES